MKYKFMQEGFTENQRGNNEGKEKIKQTRGET